METAANALFSALNELVVRKFERGAFASEDEANAYGNKITAAFAQACVQAGENDFVQKFEVLATPTFANVELQELSPLSAVGTRNSGTDERRLLMVKAEKSSRRRKTPGHPC